MPKFTETIRLAIGRHQNICCNFLFYFMRSCVCLRYPQVELIARFILFFKFYYFIFGVSITLLLPCGL